MLADASTVVTARLVGIPTPLGDPIWFEHESLSVGRFGYSGVGVEVESVRFPMGSTKVDVTLTASAEATEGVLLALVPFASQVNATVEFPPAPLGVRIEARSFPLAFVPSEIGVSVGAEVPAEVTVRLTLPDASLLPADAVVPVVLLPMHPATLVTPASLEFSSVTPSHVVELRVSTDVEVSGTALRASVPDDHGVLNVEFITAELRLRIMREFGLRFATPEGEALEEVRVLAGGTTEVSVMLARPELLLSSEEVSVTLEATGVSIEQAGVSIEQVMFVLTAAMSSSERVVMSSSERVVIGASGGAGGMLTASGKVMMGGEIVEDTRVVEAVLPVRVMREFWLRFETLEGRALEAARVLAGGSTRVAVALQNPGQLLSGEAVRVTLSAMLVTTDQPPLLTMEMSTAVVSIAAGTKARSRLGKVEASGEVLSGGSMVADTRVVSTSLAVEVVPRRFRLELGEASSDPGVTYTRLFSPGVAIPDGTNTQSVRSTINVVEDSTIDSAWVMVSITHTGLSDLIVELIAPDETIVFLHRREGGSSDGIRTIYTLQDRLSPLVGKNSEGIWVLTIGDYLGLDTGSLDAWGIGFGPRQVQAVPGIPTAVPARLVGIVTPLGHPVLSVGETLSVDVFGYSGEGVMAEPFEFTEGSTEVDVTLTVSAQATDGVLSAFVSPFALPNAVVEVLPLEVRIMRRFLTLVFKTSEGRALKAARVLAGGSTRVAVALQNPGQLLLGEEVQVTLSAMVVTTDVPGPTLTLTEEMSSTVVSIAAGTQARSRLGKVEASGEVLSGGSMVADTRVASTSLAVEVVPRRFRLELGEASSDPGVTYTRLFSPGVAIPDNTRTQSVRSTINVVEDSTIDSAWVMVSITHPEPSDLIVGLIAPDETRVSLHNMEDGSYDGIRTIYTLQDRLDVAGSRGEWVLTVGDYALDDIGSLGAWGIGFGPRQVQAVAGIPTAAPARLVGIATPLGHPVLSADETLSVDVFGYSGEGVMAEPFEFTEGSTEVDVTLTVSVQATDGVLSAFVSPLALPNAVVEVVPLEVRIVQRLLTLVFKTSEGGVLPEARVLAGGSTRVAVALQNPEQLLSGEEVQVTLSAMVVTTDVPGLTLTLTEDVASTVVSIAAGTGFGPRLGEVEASGEVLSDDPMVADVPVVSASLAVEIVPRRFRLELGEMSSDPGATYMRFFDSSVAIPDNTGRPVHSVLNVEEDSTIESAWVMVSITHPSRGHLRIALTGPDETRMLLRARQPQSASDFSRDNIREVYTTREDSLSSLVGAGSRGEWKLEVDDLYTRGTGRLDTWGIGFGLRAPRQTVMRGISTVITARLVGVKTPLGAPTLSAHEMLMLSAESFRYSGEGEGTVEPFEFTEGSTEVDVTLTASAQATDGVLLAFVPPARLLKAVVEIVPLEVRLMRQLRLLTLEFKTPEGGMLPEARVLAGGTTRVVVALQNPEDLGMNEEVQVTLSAMVVTTVEPELTLTQRASSMVVSIAAGTESGPQLGEVEASGEVLSSGSVVMDAGAVSASLTVEIVPRRFRLELGEMSSDPGATYTRFLDSPVAIPDNTRDLSVHSVLNVVEEEDSTIKSAWVMVSITHPAQGNLRIALTAPNLTRVILHERSPRPSPEEESEFFRDYMREVYTTRGDSLSSLIGAGSRGEWKLEVGDYYPLQTGRLEAWGIGFGLRAPRQARVVAGISTAITARLVGVKTPLGAPTLSAREMLILSAESFRYSGEEGVTVEPFEFTEGSTEVDVTLTASAQATDGVLLAFVPPARLLKAVVEIVPLEVRIIMRRLLTLEFKTPGGGALEVAQVLAGGETRVAVALQNPEDLRMNEVVRLTLSATTGTTVEPELTLTLTQRASSMVVTIAAGTEAGPLLEEVEASGEVLLDGSMVADAQVASASLAVEVVPRSFRLSVHGSGRVVAGSTTEVRVRVSGVDTPLGTGRLFAGETLQVHFVYKDGAGVSLLPVSLSVDSPASVATVTALPTATRGVLELTGSGLAKAMVEPTSLAIEVLPQEFRLEFTPPEIGMLAGTTETVNLSLTGASLLLPAERVVVELSLADDSTVRLVSMETLEFSALTPSHEVELEALAGDLGATTLSAVVTSSPTNLLGADFVNGELAVNVIDSREFMWVFRSAETRVELSEVLIGAGGPARVLVSLEGVRGESLVADEEVMAMLTAPAGMTVSPLTLVAMSDDLSPVITLMADADAMSGELMLQTEGMPLPRVMVERSAALPVRVVTGVLIEAAAPEVNEDDALGIVFTLTRQSDDLSSPLTVRVSVDEPRDGNRVLVEDAPYMASAVFEANSMTATLQLAVDDDTVWEPLRTTVMATVLPLPGEEYGPVLPLSASVQVLDNDIPAIRFRFVSLTGEVDEGGEYDTVEISVETLGDEPPHDEIRVDGHVQDHFLLRYLTRLESEDNVMQSADFVAFSTEVSISYAGFIFEEDRDVWSKVVPAPPVTIIDDAIAEGEETFRLFIRKIGSDDRIRWVSMAQATHEVRIIDNDIVSLSFLTAEDDPLAAASVLAGGMTEVELVLTNAESLDGVYADRVVVTLTTETVTVVGTDTVGVSDDVVSVTLTADEPSETLTIRAAAGETLEVGKITATGVVKLADADVATVGPVELDVTINPAPVLREFTFSFTTLDGAPLEIITPTVQILVGGSNSVRLVLDNPELLRMGEEFILNFVPALPNGRVSSGQRSEVGDVVTFSTDLGSNVPLQTVTLVGLTGRVELESDGEQVLHTRVVPGSLRVEFVPRRFRLSLSPAGVVQFSRTERPNEVIPDDTVTQSVHSIINVGDEITIESLTVQVEIRHPRIEDLNVLLASPEGTVVVLHDPVGGLAENLFETYTSLDHAGLAALVGEPAQGEWTLSVGDYAPGETGTLEAWNLEINGFAPVLAGGSVSLVASLSAIRTPLLGVPELFAGETLEVALAYDDGTGVALSESLVTFDAERTAVGVTLDALLDATRGTLTAVVAGAISVNAEIAPAALPVEITPRRFRLSLSGAPFGDAPFVGASRPVALIPDGQSSLRSVITVPGITIESLVVQVAIRHRDISELVVVLVPPGVVEEEGVLLHDQAIAFEKAYTSVRSGLADLVGRGFPAGDWVLRVEDFQGRNAGVLNAWYLEINTGAQVIAGESVPVVATLSGVDTPFGASRLFAGETLTVDWTDTDGADVTLSPVVFDVTSPTSSIKAASTLSAMSDATAGVLEATFGAALLNAEIDPALVPVQPVQPVQPIRRFRLAFATPAGVLLETAQVLAGGTTEVAVVLENPGLLNEGEVVRVSLSTEIVIAVPSAPSALTLTPTTPRTTLTIAALFDAVPPLGMVVASGEVLSGDVDVPVANTRVVSTTLAVEIAPRHFRLVVEKGGAGIDFEYVAASGSIEVVVGIEDAGSPLGDSVLDVMSETLQVGFVYTEFITSAIGEGVTLSPVSLGAGNTSKVGNDALLALATIDASEGATSGVLQLTGSGLVNANVAPVALRIVVLPNEFRLVFEPPQIGILTGRTGTVVLSLTNASRLPAGDEVLVGLFLVDASTVSVVSQTALPFSASATSHEVVLRAAADTSPGATVLVASVGMPPASLADAGFVDAELPVSIVGAREFEWVFRSPQGERLSTAVVVASASTRVDGASMPRVDGALTRLLVSLEGVAGERLFDDEQVKVNVSVSAGAQSGLEIEPDEFTFRAGEMSQELELELTALLPLAVQRDDLQLQLLETMPSTLRTTIPPSATLPVQVLREFTVSLALPNGTPLEITTAPDNTSRGVTTVQVLVGGNRRVVLVLDNLEFLGVDEKFLFDLLPSLPNGRVGSSHNSEPGDAVNFSTDLGSNVSLQTVTLGLIDGKVVLSEDEDDVLHTRVVPITLRVEFVPRRFRLSLSPAGVVQFSRTERPNQAIPDAFRGSVQSDITVGDEITIESLAVRVEIRHPRIGDLRVLLLSPEGTVVELHDEAGGSAENLFETYTSLDHAGLAALVGAPAQGEWTLSVGDHADGNIGTLEAWSLEINGFAPLLAGGSAAVTASLVAVETPLGTPQLFTHETLAGVGPEVVEVALAYDDGTGVALSTQRVIFDAERTAVDVTLDALFDATRGTLTAVAGAISVNAEIAPAALPVEIAPRRFRLSLSGRGPFSRTVRPNELIPDDTGMQSVHSIITVEDEITIESLTVQVEIRHPFIGDLRVLLVSPEGAMVALHDPAGSGTENLFETYTSLDHAGLAALVGAPAQGEWTLTVGDYADQDIGTLEAWSLEISGFTPVLAGESTPVVVTLSGVDTPFGASRLFAGERLAVDWTYTDGVGVTLSPVVFDVTSPTSSIKAASTLSATLEATAGVLEATFDAAAGLVNAEIDPAVQPVSIVDEREFEWVFRSPQGGRLSAAVVVASASTRVAGASSPQVTGALTRVLVSLEGVAGERLLDNEQVNVSVSAGAQLGLEIEPDEFTFRAGEMSQELELELVAFLPLAVQMDDLQLQLLGTVPDTLSTTIPSSATLPVRVLREFTFSFATRDGAPLEITTPPDNAGPRATTLRILVGNSHAVVLVLDDLGLLGVGEEFFLDLPPPLPNGRVSSSQAPEPGNVITFSVDAESDVRPRTVTLNDLAGKVKLGGSDGEEVLHTRVVPVSLRVEIVPRRFRLSLSPAGVVQFSRTERPNGVIPDDTDTQSVHSTITVEDEITIESLAVRVEISHLDIGDLRVLLVSPEGAVVALHDQTSSSAENLFETYTSLDHADLAALVGGAAQGEWTLTVGDYVSGDTGTLEAWSLEINGFVRVLAGDSVSLVASLLRVKTPPLGTPRLFAGERPEVALAYDGTGVALSEQMVTFTAGQTAVDVTLDALLDATRGTLTAVAGAISVNAEIAPAALRIEVLPNEFRLVFEPPQIGILTGMTGTVVLSLTNASRLPAGDEVLVGLFLDDASTVSVVSQTELSFDASATSHEVVLRAAADTSPGATVLVASVEMSPASLSDVGFVGAELPVSTVGAREFEWVFRSPQGERLSTAVVVASASTRVDGASPRVTGASTRVLVSLEGVAGESLLGDEQVNVSVSAGAQLGLEIEPDEFTFRAGEMSQELELELTAFLPLAVQRDDLQLQLLGTVLPGTQERTTIPPSATLPVQVLREFTISFALPDGTPLEITTPPDNTSRGITTVQILSGGDRTVMWVLDNPEFLDTELLGGDEKFLFDLLPPLRHGRVQSGQDAEPGDVFTFSMQDRSDLLPGTVQLRGLLAGRVVLESNDKEVLHTRVVPITLLVEIAPRRFRLSLSPAAGKFSRTEHPNEAIPGTFRQSVESDITVRDEITIESLAVRVEIRHPRIGDLNVLLISSGGAVVVVLSEVVSGPAEENLFETYTSLDHAGLAALAGESAQGQWTLSVGDYFSGETGTLEAWSLEINGFARVLASGSVSLVASLSAIETPPLGIPRVFAGEELEVVLAYDDGTGVALSTQRVMFDAEFTPVGVTLDALFDATSGTLTAVAGVISVNAEIAPAALPVEIAPRRFRLSLSGRGPFSRTERPNEAIPIPDGTDIQSVRSVITVEDEITIESLTVQVEIRHPFIEDLRVLLVSPEGAMVALHDPAGSTAENLFETYTSLDHAGLAALVGAPAQGEWTLTVGDYAGDDTGTLEAWSLEISGFTPLLAGESIPVVVTLSGVDTPFGASRLFAGERLAVDWTYTDGAGVTLSPVVFDVTSTTSSVEAASTLTATSGRDRRGTGGDIRCGQSGQRRNRPCGGAGAAHTPVQAGVRPCDHGAGAGWRHDRGGGGTGECGFAEGGRGSPGLSLDGDRGCHSVCTDADGG